MTTICWDGKTLASDSRASQQSIAMIGDAQKIYTPEPHEYWEIQGVKVLAFALAGEDTLPWIKEELEKGITHRTDIPELIQTDFVIIAVTEKGDCWYWGIGRHPRAGRNDIVISQVTGPCAAGTGQVVATAVMSIGKSAKEAVKQAIRLDNHSGGAIQSWDFPGVPEVLSTRPVKEDAPVFTQTQLDKAVAEAVKANGGQAGTQQVNGDDFYSGDEPVKIEKPEKAPA